MIKKSSASIKGELVFHQDHRNLTGRRMHFNARRREGPAKNSAVPPRSLRLRGEVYFFKYPPSPKELKTASYSTVN